MAGRENGLICFDCDFSGWYSFGKIIKTVATRCHFKGKMHEIRTQLGELTAPPQPHYLDLMGPTSKGNEGKEGRERKGVRGGERAST